MPPTSTEEQLLRDEKLVEYAYRDSEGYWTIGVGRLIDARKGGGLTKDECVYLLRNDIARVNSKLVQALPWSGGMDPVRWGVLVNMAFNLGVAGLLAFKNTLELVKEAKYAEAADEMLKSKWAEQVGDRAHRLAQQMISGEWV